MKCDLTTLGVVHTLLNLEILEDFSSLTLYLIYRGELMDHPNKA